MRTYIYTPDLSKVRVVKDVKEQRNFFGKGHPQFLIPDFCKELQDIWTSFMEYYEREFLSGEEIYDQNGGEVDTEKIIDSATGLTRCKYTAWFQPTDDADPDGEFEVLIEGYVVVSDEPDYYFFATKVEVLGEKSKFE